jgi:hypothetical protein
MKKPIKILLFLISIPFALIGIQILFFIYSFFVAPFINFFWVQPDVIVLKDNKPSYYDYSDCHKYLDESQVKPEDACLHAKPNVSLGPYSTKRECIEFTYAGRTDEGEYVYSLTPSGGFSRMISGNKCIKSDIYRKGERIYKKVYIKLPRVTEIHTLVFDITEPYSEYTKQLQTFGFTVPDIPEAEAK